MSDSKVRIIKCDYFVVLSYSCKLLVVISDSPEKVFSLFYNLWVIFIGRGRWNQTKTENTGAQIWLYDSPLITQLALATMSEPWFLHFFPAVSPLVGINVKKNGEMNLYFL